MYVIQKCNKFEDTIQLQNTNGEVERELHIVIDDMLHYLKKFREANLEFVKAQRLLKEKPEDTAVIEMVGSAIITTFNGLFGQDNTENILCFYENNYTQMLVDFMPYINNIMVPAMQRAAKSKMKRLKNPKKWSYGK